MNKCNSNELTVSEHDNRDIHVIEISGESLIDGELYIFSRNNPPLHECKPLWGVIDSVRNGAIRLESCTEDFTAFRFWAQLPAEFRFCRRATQFEALEYGWHCGYYLSCGHDK